MSKTGNLSINSDNIFPIIKKWLYSDHDIFIRELVSNGCDAITKLKKLELMGEFSIPEDDELKVQVKVDPDEKTITFTDNGIGMTAEEVDEYINQIAFSGAEAFLAQYKDKTNEDQIIGHFGLGFYSAFMVSDRVTIESLSYKEGAKAVFWECENGLEFNMDDSDKETRGTVITLYLNDDSLEFSNEYRAREVLDKYCSFMPVNIYLSKQTKEPEYETIDDSEVTEKDTVVEHIVEPAKTEEKDKEDGSKETVEISPEKHKAKILKRPSLISDPHPLWAKHPNECTEDEYKDFYRKVFKDYKEPLFWIHLNMDYPFNLKGILYFPKINLEYESAEGVIKLYNNQVFIADNIKEVIPEFLMLLKGVIDCPDLPLNVSRSALQNDGFVKKISDYITKKVADKLSGMCKTDRENYEKYWDDISPFIKYGCLRDEKFCEKMSDYILFKNLEGKYITFKDALEENKEKHGNTIFYVTDSVQQSQYINIFKVEGIDAVILKDNIDQPFISQLEQKNEGVRFKRVDTDVDNILRQPVGENPSEEDAKELQTWQDTLGDLFVKYIPKETVEFHAERLKDENIASVILLPEEARRMADMMKQYGMADADPSIFGGSGETLVLNVNNNLVQYLIEHPDSEYADPICKQLYDLAVIAHHPLDAASMTSFIERSNKLLTLLTEKDK